MRTREPPPKIVDTTTWLTANQVVDMLSVAHDTVKQWERRGILHPQMAKRQLSNGASREVRVYDPHEVAGIPRRRTAPVPNDPGELSARAFELFEQGKPAREIVMALREAPAKIVELHEQWMNLGGCDVVIGQVAAEEIARLVGPFDGVAGLVERLTETVQLVEQLRARCNALSARGAASLAVVREAIYWVAVEEGEEEGDCPAEGVSLDPVRDRIRINAMASLRKVLADYHAATTGGTATASGMNGASETVNGTATVMAE